MTDPRTDLRDRFFTPRMARTITSPSAILLAGAGTAVGILVGLPVAAAAVLGAAVYGGRVALALRDPRDRTTIDPNVLQAPWRQFVQEAMDARARYGRAVQGAVAGPLRDRLQEIGRRIDDGVTECWRIAQRGQELQSALRELEDPKVLRKRLAGIRKGEGGRWASEAGRAQAEQALEAQIASTERVAGVAREAADRLRVLDARLDEAVARAVELSLRAGDATEAGGLGSDVDALVAEMESLRQALEETSGGARETGAPG